MHSIIIILIVVVIVVVLVSLVLLFQWYRGDAQSHSELDIEGNYRHRLKSDNAMIRCQECRSCLRGGLGERGNQTGDRDSEEKRTVFCTRLPL